MLPQRRARKLELFLRESVTPFPLTKSTERAPAANRAHVVERAPAASDTTVLGRHDGPRQRGRRTRLPSAPRAPEGAQYPAALRANDTQPARQHDERGHPRHRR